MKNIIILLLLISSICTSQIKDFFKYSTFYTSMTMGTSFVETEDYTAVNKGYEETTQINPYDYNFTLGIRKIARYDYEQKSLRDGEEWYNTTSENFGKPYIHLEESLAELFEQIIDNVKLYVQDVLQYQDIFLQVLQSSYLVQNNFPLCHLSNNKFYYLVRLYVFLNYLM